LGAEQFVPWEAKKDLKRLIARLKKKNFCIMALEKSETSIELSKIDQHTLPENIALIVGNEVDGIADDILSIVDHVVHIPMRGKKESLNVSIAAGIAMYEISQMMIQ
jgi:tRNA G18 (ribose-2'-O)-methylase SpoU